MEPCRKTARLGSRRRVGIRPRKKRQRRAMVRALRAELGTEHGTVHRVARQLGYGTESVRSLGSPRRYRRRPRPRSWYRRCRADEGPGAREPGAETGQRDPEVVREFLRGAAGPPTPEVVAFIDANRHDVVQGRKLGVEPIRAVLQVAPSVYYAAKARQPSARSQRDAGSQSTSVRYGERLAQIGTVPSIGTVGDSYDNAPMTTRRPRPSTATGRS